ncbi:MAG: HAMP domain-containing histidine kinase [Clostridiales bacterium]|nr:HAMP domain-containing histidine kinase [Clostridiales bacterium]
MICKSRPRFRLVQFRWIFAVDCIVVIGAVMAYGAVARFWLGMTEENALSMVAIIPLMVLVVGLSTAIILHSIRRKMGTLLDGIQAVSDGDLDTELDCRNAGEYTSIYQGFNRMTAELKKTKQEMQSFVNEFSHEFKTPITSIAGFSQYLLDTGEGIESPERMQYLQVISEESLRLSTLAQNTLLLSKVESCEIIAEKERYDLSEQLRHCAILLLPKLEQKDISLEMEVDDLCYTGNAELMEQVWLNLLNNAVKFTPEHGKIMVTGKQTAEELVLAFSDSGIGMDEETAAHIFEKYYQHDTVSAVRGNGIGLSIVARIVALCGGTVQVQSAPNEGSTFTVCLPLT